MLTDQEKKRLEELRTKAGLSDPEWEELRKLDKKEEGTAKPAAGSEEGKSAGEEGEGGKDE